MAFRLLTIPVHIQKQPPYDNITFQGGLPQFQFQVVLGSQRYDYDSPISRIRSLISFLTQSSKTREPELKDPSLNLAWTWSTSPIWVDRYRFGVTLSMFNGYKFLFSGLVKYKRRFSFLRYWKARRKWCIERMQGQCCHIPKVGR